MVRSALLLHLFYVFGAAADELPDAPAADRAPAPSDMGEWLAADEACSGDGADQGGCAISALQSRSRQISAAGGSGGVAHELRPSKAEDILQEQAPPCQSQTNHPCVDGYRAHSNCKAHYMYKGRNYSGCTTADSWRKWCSLDSVHRQGSYEYCVPCREKAVLSLPWWAGVASNLRCLTVSLLVGNAKRRTYEFENNQDCIDSATWVASAGKWPVAVAIARAVRSGHLNWDTRANEVFDWWTNDPRDARSGVTLHNLLQFASGFEAANPDLDSHGWDIPCMWPHLRDYSLEGCAQQIYDKARHGTPGRKFAYNSFHLQIALAMATNRTGLSPQQFLTDNLYIPAGMTQTYVLGESNPLVAAFMFASGADYASFLQRYLAYELLPKSFCDVMETPGRHAGNPNFTMGFEVSGSELRWGGAIHPYLSRSYGVYAVVMPKKLDYIKYVGFAGQENPFGQYIGAGHDVFPWIRYTIYHLGAWPAV